MRYLIASVGGTVRRAVPFSNTHDRGLTDSTELGRSFEFFAVPLPIGGGCLVG
jgi:hypothetical protein